MTRLDRYMVREMVIPFLIGQGAVVLMLTGTVLYNNADQFLNFHIPAVGIAKVAFFFLPYLVNLTMPVAMAIAASLAVSRLARDSEITVMRAAGISLKRIFLPVFIVGAFVSFGDFYFGERVVPWSTRAFERTMGDLSRSVGFLMPAQQQVVQSPDKKLTAYVGRITLMPASNQAKLQDITLIIRDTTGVMPGRSEDLPRIIHAREGDYNDGVWKLRGALIHQFRNGGMDDIPIRGNVEINFRLAEKTFAALTLNMPLYSGAASSSAAEIAERIAMGRKQGFTNQRDLLDYHFKLSVPFSCLVFALACPPLSLRFARAGNFMGVLLSIILVFVYWNTLLAAKILGSAYPQSIPPVVAAWGQNVVFSAIGLYFLWRGE